MRSARILTIVAAATLEVPNHAAVRARTRRSDELVSVALFALCAMVCLLYSEVAMAKVTNLSASRSAFAGSVITSSGGTPIEDFCQTGEVMGFEFVGEVACDSSAYINDPNLAKAGSSELDVFVISQDGVLMETSGAVNSRAGIFDPGLPSSSESVGIAELTWVFSVDEPTPYSLYGELLADYGVILALSSGGSFERDLGTVVTLTETGSGEAIIDYVLTDTIDDAVPEVDQISFSGVLEPGEYRMQIGAVSRGLANEAGVISSGATYDIVVYVPEPQSAFLCFAALLTVAAMKGGA